MVMPLNSIKNPTAAPIAIKTAMPKVIVAQSCFGLRARIMSRASMKAMRLYGAAAEIDAMTLNHDDCPHSSGSESDNA